MLGILAIKINNVMTFSVEKGCRNSTRSAKNRFLQTELRSCRYNNHNFRGTPMKCVAIKMILGLYCSCYLVVKKVSSYQIASTNTVHIFSTKCQISHILTQFSSITNRFFLLNSKKKNNYGTKRV